MVWPRGRGIVQDVHSEKKKKKKKKKIMQRRVNELAGGLL